MQDWTGQRLTEAERRLQELPGEIDQARQRLAAAIATGEMHAPEGWHQRIEGLELEVRRREREIELLEGEQGREEKAMSSMASKE